MTTRESDGILLPCDLLPGPREDFPRPGAHRWRARLLLSGAEPALFQSHTGQSSDVAAAADVLA